MWSFNLPATLACTSFRKITVLMCHYLISQLTYYTMSIISEMNYFSYKYNNPTRTKSNEGFKFVHVPIIMRNNFVWSDFILQRTGIENRHIFHRHLESTEYAVLHTYLLRCKGKIKSIVYHPKQEFHQSIRNCYVKFTKRMYGNFLSNIKRDKTCKQKKLKISFPKCYETTYIKGKVNSWKKKLNRNENML